MLGAGSVTDTATAATAASSRSGGASVAARMTRNEVAGSRARFRDTVSVTSRTADRDAPPSSPSLAEAAARHARTAESSRENQPADPFQALHATQAQIDDVVRRLHDANTPLHQAELNRLIQARAQTLFKITTQLLRKSHLGRGDLDLARYELRRSSINQLTHLQKHFGAYLPEDRQKSLQDRIVQLHGKLAAMAPWYQTHLATTANDNTSALLERLMTTDRGNASLATLKTDLASLRDALGETGDSALRKQCTLVISETLLYMHQLGVKIWKGMAEYEIPEYIRRKEERLRMLPPRSVQARQAETSLKEARAQLAVMQSRADSPGSPLSPVTPARSPRAAESAMQMSSPVTSAAQEASPPVSVLGPLAQGGGAKGVMAADQLAAHFDALLDPLPEDVKSLQARRRVADRIIADNPRLDPAMLKLVREQRNATIEHIETLTVLQEYEDLARALSASESRGSGSAHEAESSRDGAGALQGDAAPLIAPDSPHSSGAAAPRDSFADLARLSLWHSSDRPSSSGA